MPRTFLQPNVSRLITLATVALIVAILYVAYAIFVPLALAVLFTFLLSPIVSRLEHWHVRRTPAVVGVVLVCCFIVVFIGWIVAGQVSNLANNLDR
jgi:predicted PurR-regulated permease PerM